MYCDTWSWHSEDRTYQGRELVQIEMKATGAKDNVDIKDIKSKDIKKKPAGAKHNCGKRKSAGAKATKKKPAGRSHGKC